MMVLGFVLAAIDSARTRARALDAPLVAISLAAALAAAVAFTNHLLISTPAMGALEAAQWKAWAAKLPGSHIAEAMDLLLGAR